jgi:uncharacterized membrane protein
LLLNRHHDSPLVQLCRNGHAVAVRPSGGLRLGRWTGHCHAYEALGFSSAEHSDQTSIPSGQGIKVEHDVTIQKPADELFRFWRTLDNLPRIMRHLNSVEDLGNGRSRWNAKGPFGDVQWEAEIITERPGELIGWRSLENSTIQTAGSVHFRRAPGDRGMEVKVVLSYNPPGGQVGHALAWLAGSDPKAEIREDLRNFKRTMETASAPSPHPRPRLLLHPPLQDRRAPNLGSGSPCRGRAQGRSGR